MPSCLCIGAPQWVPTRISTVHYGPYAGKPCLAHNKFHNTTSDKRTSGSNRPWVNRVFRNKCSHIVILHSYMVAEPVLRNRWSEETLVWLTKSLKKLQVPMGQCELPCLQGNKLVQSICFLTDVVVMRHEGEHSRSWETQSHQKDQSGEQAHQDSVHRQGCGWVCCDAATETSGCRTAQGLERSGQATFVRWKRYGVFRTTSTTWASSAQSQFLLLTECTLHRQWPDARRLSQELMDTPCVVATTAKWVREETRSDESILLRHMDDVDEPILASPTRWSNSTVWHTFQVSPGSWMSENGNGLQELRWHRAERQMQKIQKMLHSKVQNMLMPDPNRQKAFSRLCTAAAGTAKETQRGAHWKPPTNSGQNSETWWGPRAIARNERQNKTRNRSWPQCEWHCEAGDDDQRNRQDSRTRCCWQDTHSQDTSVQCSLITARTAHSMRLAWLKFKTKRDLRASLCPNISLVTTYFSYHTTRTLSTSSTSPSSLRRQVAPTRITLAWRPAEWRKPAHNNSHRLWAQRTCHFLKNRSLFWRSISII